MVWTLQSPSHIKFNWHPTPTTHGRGHPPPAAPVTIYPYLYVQVHVYICMFLYLRLYVLEAVATAIAVAMGLLCFNGCCHDNQVIAANSDKVLIHPLWSILDSLSQFVICLRCDGIVWKDWHSGHYNWEIVGPLWEMISQPHTGRLWLILALATMLHQIGICLLCVLIFWGK